MRYTPAVIQDGSAWLLSPKGKIVEQLPASQAGDYAVIDGCELLAPRWARTSPCPQSSPISRPVCWRCWRRWTPRA
ncbi:MAG: hypothetical protein ACLTYN_12595 [Dysosmobacter welbionis]